MKNVLLFSIFIFFLSPVISNAQYEINSSIASGEALYMSNFSMINNTLMNSYKKSSRKSKSKTISSTSASLRSLDFTRSSAISNQAKSTYINQLSKANPTAKPQLEKLLANGRLINEFDKLLAGYGFSGRNLADVMTAYLVLNWQIANGQEYNNKSGFNSVREMVQESLASNSKMKNVPDAEKQKVAETMAYQSMIALAGYQNLKKKNDTAGLAKLQQSVYDSVKQLGFDLKAVQLTANGFIGR
ncbi:hypothetical protein GCM10028807_35850 [Spirosoma daeguense]